MLTFKFRKLIDATDRHSTAHMWLPIDGNHSCTYCLSGMSRTVLWL